MSAPPDLRNEVGDRFPVSVITERRAVADRRWTSEQFEVVGVVAGSPGAGEAGRRRAVMRESDAGAHVLWTGFSIELFKDEAESYYCNLRGEHPSVFVVCRQEDDDPELVPFLVTLSYDESASYLEVDDQVFSVPIPPELYVWLERYVVANYVPQPPRRRKRKSWHQKEDTDEQRR